jgi:hypothetical protein
LADAALKGERVEFVHRGVTFKVVPEPAADKLKNIAALRIVNPKFRDLKPAEAALRSEMLREWRRTGSGYSKQEKWTRDPFDRVIVSHAK